MLPYASDCVINCTESSTEICEGRELPSICKLTKKAIFRMTLCPKERDAYEAKAKTDPKFSKWYSKQPKPWNDKKVNFNRREGND